MNEVDHLSNRVRAGYSGRNIAPCYHGGTPIMENTRAPIEMDVSSLRSETRHPFGTRAKVLLASVFGPYAQDDDYGSRLINPREPSMGRTVSASSLAMCPAR